MCPSVCDCGTDTAESHRQVPLPVIAVRVFEHYSCPQSEPHCRNGATTRQVSAIHLTAALAFRPQPKQRRNKTTTLTGIVSVSGTGPLPTGTHSAPRVSTMASADRSCEPWSLPTGRAFPHRNSVGTSVIRRRGWVRYAYPGLPLYSDRTTGHSTNTTGVPPDTIRPRADAISGSAATQSGHPAARGVGAHTRGYRT